MGLITSVPETRSPNRVQVGLCDLADEDTIVIRNVSNNLPLDAGSHLRRLESAANSAESAPNLASVHKLHPRTTALI
jgi:hypothetical protein